MTPRELRAAMRMEMRMAEALAGLALVFTREAYCCAEAQAFCNATKQHRTDGFFDKFRPENTIDLTTAPGAHWLCDVGGMVAQCGADGCHNRVRFVPGRLPVTAPSALAAAAPRLAAAGVRVARGELARPDTIVCAAAVELLGRAIERHEERAMAKATSAAGCADDYDETGHASYSGEARAHRESAAWLRNELEKLDK